MVSKFFTILACFLITLITAAPTANAYTVVIEAAGTTCADAEWGTPLGRCCLDAVLGDLECKNGCNTRCLTDPLNYRSCIRDCRLGCENTALDQIAQCEDNHGATVSEVVDAVIYGIY